MPSIYFEDFVPGSVTTYGTYAVTREEIVDFARQFDPQPMHLDEDAAKATMLGGLSASGWHSCAMLMRMIADGFILDAAGMGSPGIDEVRWVRPVRPGDVLSVRQTVLEARPSAKKGDRGYVRFRFELVDAEGNVAMEQVNSIIFARRNPGAPA